MLAYENYNISIKELINATQINEFYYNNTIGRIPKIIDEINHELHLL